MSKYINADRLQAEIKRQIRLENLNFAALGGGGQTFCINTLEWVLKQIDSLQQEQPSEICSRCIHHGKDDDYCYNPHGGMRSLINENGVYECTGFCEQEQPEVALEKEIEEYWSTMGWNKVIEIRKFRPIARYFYGLGQLNSK